MHIGIFFVKKKVAHGWVGWPQHPAGAIQGDKKDPHIAAAKENGDDN